MKIVDLTQGSDDWRAFREKGIGASDASCLVGKNPWKNMEKLYLEKTMGVIPFSNAAMDRGIDLEPKAREEMEKRLGIKLLPLCAIHDEFDFIRASFDGINIEKKTLIEIKCPGPKDHAEAVNGRVPPKYKYQLQWQLLITGYEIMTYVSFDGEKSELVDVPADPELQKHLIVKAKDFWQAVLDKKLPKVAEEITDDKLSARLIRSEELKVEIKKLEAELDEITVLAKESLGQNEKAICGGYIFGFTERKGNVDYTSIPEIKGLDLESYRKPSTKSFYIKKV
jgi:putative phage-type endonuclease